MNAFVIALLLILPICALVARQLPLGSIVKMAAAWIAIFAVLLLVVVLWQHSGTAR